MEWKITEIDSIEGLITCAKYYVSLKDKKYFADTEGYWHFVEPTMNVPFENVTEDMVIEWIKTESNGTIEQRLKEQVSALSKAQKVVAPWLPQVFTPEI